MIGKAYDTLSREELVALLIARSDPTAALTPPGAPSPPPSNGDRYRQVVEDAADGIFIADADSMYLDVNEAGARMLGMTREQVIGKRISDVVIDAQHSILAETLARVGAGEWILREWQVRRGDGSIFTAEVSAKQLPDGRFHGIWRDVSARRAREEELRLSERRFRALTAAAFEGIGISERGVVVDVNDQLAELLGYERSELIGRDVSLMVAPESREAVTVAMRSGRETPYRHLALRKDGTRIEVEAQARTAEWSERAVRVTAIRDIGAQLLVEERLNRVQKLEALGRLAGGIAHDFNNILLAIFSYSDLVALDAEDPMQVRAHVEGLQAAARRARDLVQQIQMFSRQKGEERTPTSVQPIVDEALRFLRSTLPTTLEVRGELAPDLPPVLGVAVQIHQVVMNLCLNAAHAMHKTGVLTVRLNEVVATPELALLAPELINARTYLCLTVRDTGRGMDAETLGRIFEPFFTTKSSAEGSGLGLAVVHGIVKAHEGAITVESAVGQGTTFEIYLPSV